MLRLILLPAFAWTLMYAAPLTVRTHMSEEIRMVPSQMEASLTFEDRDAGDAPIKQRLSALLQTVKAACGPALSCSGGGIGISPRYEASGNRQRFAGYSGGMGISCRFDAIGAFNDLTTRLASITSASPSIKTAQSPVAWIIPETAVSAAKAQVESTLLASVAAKAKSLSRNLGRECEPSRIDLTPGNAPLPMMMRSPMAPKSEGVESPISEPQTIALDGEIEFLCK